MSSSAAERGGWSPPALHLITDADILARPDVVEVARALLAVGGPRVALHLRGHGGAGAPRTGRALHALAARLVPAAAGAGALLVVNDRIDVALAAGVPAVQLGGGSLATGRLPKRAAALRVGRSVHGAGEVEAARDVDWLIVGTVYPTPSHPGRPGAGPDRIAALAAHTRHPLIGIGGVSPERVSEVLAAGGAGVAVRGGVWAARDPIEALGRYLSVFDSAPDSDAPRHP